jgi:hypothetical protein
MITAGNVFYLFFNVFAQMLYNFRGINHLSIHHCQKGNQKECEFLFPIMFILHTASSLKQPRKKNLLKHARVRRIHDCPERTVISWKEMLI